MAPLLAGGVQFWLSSLGMLDAGNSSDGQKYLVYDKFKNLQYVIDRRTVDFKNHDASLLFIRDSTALEQAHVKITETKYSQLIISTITHDLKSPITAIQGHLAVLPPFVTEKGQAYLKAAQLTAQAFEYYIYDLVVSMQ